MMLLLSYLVPGCAIKLTIALLSPVGITWLQGSPMRPHVDGIVHRVPVTMLPPPVFTRSPTNPMPPTPFLSRALKTSLSLRSRPGRLGLQLPEGRSPWPREVVPECRSLFLPPPLLLLQGNIVEPPGVAQSLGPASAHF